MIAPVMSEELKEEVLEAYLSGLSMWGVSQKFPWLKKHQIREALEGHIRPKNTQRVRDPSPEEIAERSAAVKESWSPEQAGRRWVGRMASQAESRGSCLSDLFRDMEVDL